MPEGHTLHRLARRHQKRYAGSAVAVSSPQGRFATDAEMVDGRVLRKASAWGKHLFHHYEDGPIVHVHLGLYGTFREWKRPEDGQIPEAVGQVRMRMIGDDYGTDLRGPIVCEVIDEAQVSDVVARLGPDPIRRDADPEWSWKRISKSRRAIGALLMDQKVMAGVGNVYRSELLFRHNIDPYRPGQKIGEAEFSDAWTDLVELMRIGVRRGKILTVRPEHDHGEAPRGRGRGGARKYVYRRAGDPCRVCGTDIRTAEMEGRNLFWCPTCQT